MIFSTEMPDGTTRISISPPHTEEDIMGIFEEWKCSYATVTIDEVLTLKDFVDAQREKDEQGKKMADRYNEKLAEYIRKAPKRSE